MNRVIPASTGYAYTMTANDSPVWGRAEGRFSTLTARAGRAGTAVSSFTPDSGQIGGSAGVVEPGVVGVLPVPCVSPTLPPRRTTAPMPPPISKTVTTTPSAARPRVVRLIVGESSSKERGEGQRRMLSAERAFHKHLRVAFVWRWFDLLTYPRGSGCAPGWGDGSRKGSRTNDFLLPALETAG